MYSCVIVETEKHNLRREILNVTELKLEVLVSAEHLFIHVFLLIEFLVILFLLKTICGRDSYI